MEDEVKKGLNRREFIRRAAVTTAAAAWAAPAIQTVAARPAFAQSNGTPFCGHSTGASLNTDCNEGAKGACKFACNGTCGDVSAEQADPCEQIVDVACVGAGDRPCCNAGLCDARNWTCETGGPGGTDDRPCYGGPTTGCSAEQIAALHQFC